LLGTGNRSRPFVPHFVDATNSRSERASTI
jgi:hypothetical protein